jgi:hypothetical protein
MDSISKTPLSLFRKLTRDEKLAWLNSTNDDVRIFYAEYSMAERIRSDDPGVPQAKVLLVQQRILTQERADEMFAFTDVEASQQ